MEVPHGSVLKLAHGHRKRFALSPEDRVGQIATLVFDGSVIDIWPGLPAGAELVIPPGGVMASTRHHVHDDVDGRAVRERDLAGRLPASSPGRRRREAVATALTCGELLNAVIRSGVDRR